jgi:hypothetical protein
MTLLDLIKDRHLDPTTEALILEAIERAETELRASNIDTTDAEHPLTNDR